MNNKLDSTRPVVSVVVPVYNTGTHLGNCVESILAQTYGRFELILVDDGSTDESASICDDFVRRDARVRAIHTPNRGVSSARREGFLVANGSWVRFVDSDDFVPADSLQIFVASCEGADVVIGNMVTRYQGRSIPSNYRVGSYDSRGAISGICRGYLPQMLHPICFRRQILRADDLDVPRRIPVGEDLLVSLRIARAAKAVRCLSDCVYRYDKRDESAAQRHKGPTYLDAYYEYFDMAFGGLDADEHILSESLHLRMRSVATMLQKGALTVDAPWVRTTLRRCRWGKLTARERILLVSVKAPVPMWMKRRMYLLATATAARTHGRRRLHA